MKNRPMAVFGGGAIIGALGGLVGLGGAEFRLPLLMGVFGFASLEAVIVNKAMSLIVVASALPFRAAAVPFGELFQHWGTIAKLLSGSLLGAWFGAGWAVRMHTEILDRLIAVLLVAMALLLLFAHHPDGGEQWLAGGGLQWLLGPAAGFVIGIVASLLGVAGGELLIPTLVLLFGANIKLAGSLSLAVSLPTMLMGFARYSRDRSFAVVSENKGFMTVMAIGSLFGSYLGGQWVGRIPSAWLLPLLAVILLISAFKIWRD